MLNHDIDAACRRERGLYTKKHDCIVLTNLDVSLSSAMGIWFQTLFQTNTSTLLYSTT